MNFNMEVECSAPELVKDVEGFEVKAGLELPSHYKYLLLNFNELRLANDAMAMFLNEEGEEISGVDGEVFSLQTFLYASDPFPSIEYVNNMTAKRVAKSFFTIANLFYQGVLLIGKEDENENQIFGFVPGFQDEPFFLANNIFDFFNDRITVVE